MRILLDTNVLLRSIEPGHPQHSAGIGAIDSLQRQHHELVIVPQVMYEFWSVATRPVESNGLGMTPEEAQQELTQIKDLFRLLRDERAIYEIWENLVHSLAIKGKPAHDARLAAAMQRHAVTHLLTFNMADFTRFSFITACEPSAILSGTILV